MKTKQIVRKALIALAVLGFLGFGIVSCDNGSTDVSNPTTAHVHKWGDWKEVTPATIPAAGKRQRVCTLDATHTEEEAIARLPSLIETVEVLGGSFMYGRNGTTIDGDDKLTPVATFQMGKYAVTQAQWKAVMGADKNPSWFDGTNAFDFDKSEWITVDKDKGFTRDNLPVEMVSWYDVLVFANKLSIKEGWQPAYKIGGKTDPAEWGDVPTSSDDEWNKVEIDEGANGYRLPTEHQWEFAAKGGANSAGYTGESTDTYFEYAVYSANSGGRTHEVGKKKANELGLYDMSGNVWEWCYDTYNPDDSSNRVARGGSCSDSAANVCSANRNYGSPQDRGSRLGFRLVRP